MGWLSALGASWNENYDRFQQQRRLNEEMKLRQRQQEFQEQSYADEATQRQLRDAITKRQLQAQERQDLQSLFSPGQQVSPEDWVRFREAGMENLVGPGDVYRGTTDQMQSAADLRMREAQAGEQSRQLEGMRKFEQALQADPEMGFDKMLALATQFGIDPGKNLALATRLQDSQAKMDYQRQRDLMNYQNRLQLGAIQAQARLGAAETSGKSALDRALMGKRYEDYMGAPASLGSLYSDIVRQSGPLLRDDDTGEAKRGIQSQAITSFFPQWQRRKAAGEALGIKEGADPYAAPSQLSATGQQVFAQLPTIITSGAFDPVTIIAKIQAMSDISDADKYYLRQAARSFMNELGVDTSASIFQE